MTRRARDWVRSFDMALGGNLYGGWTGSGASADAELRTKLPLMRGRSRELARNNDYVKRFLRILVQNVSGHEGVRLQVRSRDEVTQELDKSGNDLLQQRWKEWGRKGVCTVDARFSWVQLQQLVVQTAARDGEVLIRKVFDFPNGWRYALQVLEADHLPDYSSSQLVRDGNTIYMGIERDRWERPVAYHILSSHPGADSVRITDVLWIERVPANEILHIFLPDRPGQSRGVPWLHTAGTRLHMLGGYEEAELVASRAGAAKMGVWTEDEGDDAQTAFEADPTEEIAEGQTERDQLIDRADPGTFFRAPPGLKLEKWDPDHPSTAFEGFETAILRGISAGLNISYPTLSMDLSGVSYSSIRQGVLDDRDAYRCLQIWLVEELCWPVYEDWLRVQKVTDRLGLPARKLDRFRDASRFLPRGWSWVDPQKDVEASRRGVALGVQTRTRIAAEQGRDLVEVFDELQAEQKLATELGLDVSAEKGSGASPPEEVTLVED